MDGSRNYKDIKLLLKNKNIISSTYDSVDILNKIIKKLENYIIFIDEFHNLSINNLENSEDQINKLLVSNKKIIYLSATPIQSKKYNDIFGNYIYKYDWGKAIENKYICDFKIILPEDTTDTKIFDEFLKNIKYNETNKELIIKCYFILKGLNYYGNKKTILYTTNIDEATEYSNIMDWMKKMLNVELETNIINYKTSKINRIEYIKKFKTNNKNQILINVQILNEGIDIPECDSVFITKPNENIVNLIQRMCRCNRILKNKFLSFIFLWCNKNDKIFKYLNKFINYKYNIDCYKINRPILLIENNKQKLLIENDKQILLIKNNKNNLAYNNNKIVEFLKKYSLIDNQFIDNFYSFYDADNNKFNFTIELNNISNWLNIKKEHLKRLLVNNFTEKKDYIQKKETNKKSRGKNNTIHVLLTYDCAKLLCMISKSEKACEIRNFYINIENLLLKNIDKDIIN
jgi:phage anti-repressor protein